MPYTFVSVTLDCEGNVTVTFTESCKVYNVFALSVESRCFLLNENQILPSPRFLWLSTKNFKWVCNISEGKQTSSRVAQMFICFFLKASKYCCIKPLYIYTALPSCKQSSKLEFDCRQPCNFMMWYILSEWITDILCLFLPVDWEGKLMLLYQVQRLWISNDEWLS